MRKLFIFIPLFSLISCDTNNPDIKISAENNDTIEVSKRHPSAKIKEIIFYKNNKPDSNVCYIEDVEVIKHPKLILMKETRSVFFFIPIATRFKRISIFFNAPNSDMTKIFELANFTKSVDFPIETKMITNDTIKGAIQGERPDGTFDRYPFTIPYKN